MSAPTIRDGTRVLFMLYDHAGDGRPDRKLVRAFAIGDHAVIGKRALLPEGDEPERDVRVLGWLRPGLEGVRWCRGWKGTSARVLSAQLALENSR